LIKVPKDLPLDDVQLAGLILKGMTAQYLLHRTHKVQPGDYVLIHRLPALDKGGSLQAS
jgi:NADPH2:quinone reductase